LESEAVPTNRRPDPTPAERRKAMTWAQRLSRVFKIEVTRCERRGGPVRLIASLSDPAIIDRVLAARGRAELHGPARGLPQGAVVLG
jgi:hypothetical protein